MTKKEYWVRMGRIGYTKEIFCRSAGVNLQSVYNWKTVPRYAEWGLVAVEKSLSDSEERFVSDQDDCRDKLDKIISVLGGFTERQRGDFK